MPINPVYINKILYNYRGERKMPICVKFKSNEVLILVAVQLYSIYYMLYLIELYIHIY